MSFATSALATGAGVEVRAALEAVRGVGVQAVAARAETDTDGVEPRGLDQDVLGLRGNHGVPAAHDAGQAQSLRVVGDDEIVGFERVLGAIEKLEPLALAREADDDSAVELVQVKGVGGMAHPLQNEVGGIDCIGDGLRSQQREVLGDDPGGGRNGDVAQDARGEPAAEALGIGGDLDGEWLSSRGCGGQRGVERGEREVVDGRPPRARCRSGSSHRRGWW